MQTTLNQIRKYLPCSEGWAKLLRTLKKTAADDEPLSIITILDSNGLDDALWCLRAVEDQDREIRLYGVWCARQVQHLMNDPRSILALDVAERFANGEATEQDLAAAWAAARAAALDVAWDVARAAAQSAAVAIAGAAARSLAGDAAVAIAGAAARSSARALAGDAAWAAAGTAAVAAAGAAAWAVAWAEAGASAVAIARAAAWTVAMDEQEKRLREVCSRIDAMVLA